MTNNDDISLLAFASRDSSPEAMVWIRVSAFLSRKAQLTQVTYVGVLGEWLRFLGEEPGTKAGANALCSATDLKAIAYLTWLQSQRGQSSRFHHAGAESREVVVSRNKRPSMNDGSLDRQTNRTIAKKASILRRIYTMLIGAGLVSGINPFDKDLVPPPPKESGQKRPTVMVDFSDVKRLINTPDTNFPKGVRDRAVLAVLFGGGLRRGELVNLRLGDVKRSHEGLLYLQLRGTKGKKDSYQPLPEWAEAYLLAWLEVRAQDSAPSAAWLFTGFTGKGGTVPTKKPLTANGVYQLFRRYARQSGVSLEATPHSARATAITKLLDSGLSHREVQEFSRHQSVAMVEVYDKRRKQLADNPARRIDY